MSIQRERDIYADRRANPRKKTNAMGKVMLNDNVTLLDCTILDLSDGGAKLEFSSRQVLPRTFILQLHTGAVVRVEVRWAKDNFFGVRFMGDDEE
ncbi:MAG TPA: PilZ domain-containing protein [Dongiaceae bacterium]|nr:PilZ domain-containing protein [Dongiaceae bacterium]